MSVNMVVKHRQSKIKETVMMMTMMMQKIMIVV